MLRSGIGSCKHPELFKSCLTYAALWNVYDSFKCHVVGGIGNDLHVGEHVFDFTSLIEVYAADDLVGDIHLDALLLQKS